MDFKPNPNAEPRGNSLRLYLYELTTQKMVNLFGPPIKDGYRNPDTGYDGNEWIFESENGSVVVVYSRDGIYRISAREDITAELFATWLGEDNISRF